MQKHHSTQKERATNAYHHKKSPNDKSREQERKKGTKKNLQNNWKAIHKISGVCQYLSITTLNINGLNSPIEGHNG